MYSIFDIYFRSPLATSVAMMPAPKAATPLAKRVFLFVGDGLRADKAFFPGNAPFLQTQAMTGASGISHTRVPTESRPGHVAMIGGFYEDVSAVLTGWKANTTPFDHLLNRARYAWAIGGPELVTLFQDSYPQADKVVKRPSNWDHERIDIPFTPKDHPISVQHFDARLTDFGAKDTLVLDRWSFNRLGELFQASRSNEEIKRRLNSDKLLMFVHLLGLDINGHAYGPQSIEYRQNIAFVDEGIAKAIEMIEEYYEHDGQTSYVFTADHGMSDAGTHGDGHPTCTETPFIAWGAGINAVKIKRMEQASITPFIASLLGIDIPVHSEGILTDELLEAFRGTDEQRQAMLMRSVNQVRASFEAAERSRKAREGSWYRPPSIPPLDNLQSEDEMHRAVASLQAGRRYLQKYDWMLQKGIISGGYLSWMAFCLLYLSRQRDNFWPRAMHATLAVVFFGWLLMRRAEWRMFVYAAFPVFFIDGILSRFSLAEHSFSTTKAANILLALGALECIVRAYHDRWILGLAFVGMGVYRRSVYAIILSIFPFLPLVQKLQSGVLLGSNMLCTAYAFHASKSFTDKHVSSRVKLPFLVLFASLITVHTDYSLSVKEGLPMVNKLASWVILSASICSAIIGRIQLAFGHGQSMSSSSSMLKLLPAMILLSVSYEPVFLLSFSLLLQHYSASSPYEAAIEMLLLLSMSFFGLGNIASLAHFSLPSVYRFVTIYSPFTMSALLLLKTILPIAALSHVHNAHLEHVKRVMLSACDYITLRHFYAVTDYGSWLDIGASISRFVIASSLIVVITVLLR